ncbi:helix-turn-helix domain containing protein [Frigidibacter sp. RF13]|uniref:TetR/AcrR family transcriptional regulator n=1 Tax=Frigidibacter sp. RF13 TaxID=2997340 RepID=UPI00226EFD0B|nr:TetR/AcrR family transcriptional regulator [Frigidibacter sp. RF13]MCY1126838.1 helix-turn-helix domain containing protein [Frigidibacter sp. RF13]
MPDQSPHGSPAERPRKLPQQARSQATCAAILEAAARILERQGLAGLTTNRVADLAGVSVGTLYQYYPGRDALVAELVRAKRAALLSDLAQAREAARGLPATDGVRRLLAAAIGPHLQRPRLVAALEMAEGSLALQAETARLKQAIHAILADFCRSAGMQAPAAAAQETAAMVEALVDTAVIAGEEDAAALTARVERAVLAFLDLGAAEGAQERAARRP